VHRTVVAELVPWRGALGDEAGARIRDLARDLGADRRIDAVSVTDSAGGHPMLSPEVLAAELGARGQEAIVHVTCRDRNRNELLSLGWRLASAGIGNLLVLSGDYPSEGYLGVARAVFDLDSVSLLHLYAGLSEGRLAADLVGRPVVRDKARRMAALAPVAAARTVPPAPTDFYLGAAVNPFKVRESELLPQYEKLEFKAAVGARYAITQVGFDPRKLDELVRYVAERALPLQLLANAYVLSRTAARVFAAGGIPGVILPPPLLERVEREARSPDRGKAFCLELAARQMAVARGLGFAGVYLGGLSRAADFGSVLDRANAFGADDWRAFVSEVAFPVPGTFYLYEPPAGSGLNGPRRAPLGRPRRVPLAYRADRLVHRVAFRPGSTGIRAGALVYGALERAHLGHAAHVAEQALKVPLFDCRDCGDCSLPETAYLCPESQCVKNQRNGPCGGSHDGECEIAGKRCIWVRAYERLRPYGEAETMLARPPAVADNALRRTSAWANTYLGRDHLTHK
jgi:methylenetetrahydrofolate reductase (NADPH)